MPLVRFEFKQGSIFDIPCDILVIPMSTAGSVSHSFEAGLDNSLLNAVDRDAPYKLGSVRILAKQQALSDKQIVFACSVHANSSAYHAIRSIGNTLGKIANEQPNLKHIALPLLGTGAGGLDVSKIIDILINAFSESCNRNVLLTICIPDKETFQGLTTNHSVRETLSTILVIDAEKPRIANNRVIERLLFDKQFFYELAEQKFNQYKSYTAKDPELYNRLEETFRGRAVKFSEYWSALEPGREEYEFLTLCGELIAYIDAHAYRKNIWNQYPDKRIIAWSAVRQNDWAVNLIRYKRTKSMDDLSPSIRNAFEYFDNPAEKLTMLSEKHREKAVNAILRQPYSFKDGAPALLQLFIDLDFSTNNPANFGALCSRILYLPEIKPLWDEDDPERTENVTTEASQIKQLSMATFLIEDCLRKKLPTLDLGNCGLIDLTAIPELFECDHLEELILSNEWPVYEKGMWRKETSRNFGDPNVISVIPEEITHLKNLKRLFCGGDWNSDVKSNRWGIRTLQYITQLTELEHLNLSNNRIRDTAGLSNLKNLKTIHLNNNEISEVEDLRQLNALREINLSNNRLDKVHFLSHLDNIETIDLHHNSIRDLEPLEAGIARIGVVNDQWKIGTINVAKNPMENPPMEIIMQGKDAVLRIFKDIRERGHYSNRDIKIVLVGNSEAGKSTLMKYLDNKHDLDEEHEATQWMDEKVISWRPSFAPTAAPYTLRVFDFGGHDFYHDTHHLFYSPNAIYVLLWEERTNKLELRPTLQKNNGKPVAVETQDYPIEYWLDSVEHYTRDHVANNFSFDAQKKHTYRSKLMLLQNKVANSSQISHLNNALLQDKYPFVYDIINGSIIRPERNMNSFEQVFSEMLGKMDIIDAVLPLFYKDVKEQLQNYHGAPVLSRAEFQEYCNSFLASRIDEQQNDILLEYLHFIGLILYPNRNGNVYVNKNWIIRSIHSILDTLVNKKGEFSRKYISEVLNLADAQEQKTTDDILSMMLDFKMIFEHPHREEVYIAPLYLPRQRDGIVDLFVNDKMVPYRRFEYRGFIQKNVVLSVFKKYSDRLNSGDSFYYWKDGLIIKDPEKKDLAMIVFNLGDNDGNARIDVFSVPEKPANQSFIDSIISYINEVNDGYEVEEMVTLDGKNYVSMRLLKKNAEMGRVIFTERKLATPTSPATNDPHYFMLKDYQRFLSRDIIKKKKVVISYSSLDMGYVLDLIKYLNPLIDEGLIDRPWFCENMIVGSEWNEEIRDKFSNADIVFFMVSDNLFNVPYVIDYEIKETIARYDNDLSVKIIPIVLEPYDWSRTDRAINLQRFSALPFKGLPINEYEKPKVAWNMVTHEVRRLIEKDLDPAKKEIINREMQLLHQKQMQGKLSKHQ